MKIILNKIGISDLVYSNIACVLSIILTIIFGKSEIITYFVSFLLSFISIYLGGHVFFMYLLSYSLVVFGMFVDSYAYYIFYLIANVVFIGKIIFMYWNSIKLKNLKIGLIFIYSIIVYLSISYFVYDVSFNLFSNQFLNDSTSWVYLLGFSNVIFLAHIAAWCISGRADCALNGVS